MTLIWQGLQRFLGKYCGKAAVVVLDNVLSGEVPERLPGQKWLTVTTCYSPGTGISGRKHGRRRVRTGAGADSRLTRFYSATIPAQTISGSKISANLESSADGLDGDITENLQRASGNFQELQVQLIEIMIPGIYPIGRPSSRILTVILCIRSHE